MIKRIKNGRLDLDLCNYMFSASYLTNAVEDLINAFIEYKLHGKAQTWFDGEGIDYTLVLNENDETYLIVNSDSPKVYREDEKSINDLINDLLKDFSDEKLLDDASRFDTSCLTEDDIKNEKESIKKLLEYLKSLCNN